jgi:hypothetical protein
MRIVQDPNRKAGWYLQTQAVPSRTRSCNSLVKQRILVFSYPTGRARSYGGRVGDLDFVPRGRPQAGEPVEPPAAAKRHSLSHQLVPDSKGLRLLLQAAAGGQTVELLTQDTGWWRQRRRHTCTRRTTGRGCSGGSTSCGGGGGGGIVRRVEATAITFAGGALCDGNRGAVRQRSRQLSIGEIKYEYWIIVVVQKKFRLNFGRYILVLDFFPCKLFGWTAHHRKNPYNLFFM